MPLGVELVLTLFSSRLSGIACNLRVWVVTYGPLTGCCPRRRHHQYRSALTANVAVLGPCYRRSSSPATDAISNPRRGRTGRLDRCKKDNRLIKDYASVHDSYVNKGDATALNSLINHLYRDPNPTTLPKQDVLAWHLGPKSAEKSVGLSADFPAAVSDVTEG